MAKVNSKELVAARDALDKVLSHSSLEMDRVDDQLSSNSFGLFGNSHSLNTHESVHLDDDNIPGFRS